jgi:hypothetical protein
MTKANVYSIIYGLMSQGYEEKRLQTKCDFLGSRSLKFREKPRN